MSWNGQHLEEDSDFPFYGQGGKGDYLTTLHKTSLASRGPVYYKMSRSELNCLNQSLEPATESTYDVLQNSQSIEQATESTYDVLQNMELQTCGS